MLSFLGSQPGAMASPVAGGTRTRALFALVASALLGTGGCQRTETESSAPPPRASREDPAQAGPSLFTRKALLEGSERLKSRVGGSAQALELVIYRHRLVLQAQDPKDPRRVLQYRYQDGRISDAVEVELRGTGMLEDNLFPLDKVNLQGVPDLCDEALRRVDGRAGRISHVLVRRNLPLSMDIQMRVYVTSPVRDGHLDATSQAVPIE